MNRLEVEIDAKSLKYVYFQNSEVKTFTEEFLEQLRDVEYFNANQVGLERVDGRSLAKLKAMLVFWAGENKIEELEENSFSGNEKLEAIHLSFNQIRYIHPRAFNGLGNLVALDLSSNRLKSLTGVFDPLPELVRLLLSQNPIEEFHQNVFKKLERLRELKLLNINLKHLDPKVFDPLTNLEYINLSFNKSPLRKVPGSLFKRNYHLQEMILIKNSIQSIDPQFLRNYKPKLKHVSFRMNSCIVDGDFLNLEQGTIDDAGIEKFTICFRNYLNSK